MDYMKCDMAGAAAVLGAPSLRIPAGIALLAAANPRRALARGESAGNVQHA